MSELNRGKKSVRRGVYIHGAKRGHVTTVGSGVGGELLVMMGIIKRD